MHDLTLDTVAVIYTNEGAARIEVHAEKLEEEDGLYEIHFLVQKHQLGEDGINVETETVKDSSEVLNSSEMLAWVSQFMHY
jgi:hypothetical protein